MDLTFLDGLQMSFELLLKIVAAEPALTLLLIIMFIMYIAVLFTMNFIKHQRLKKSGILEIDKMNGQTFEEYLKVLLENRGYQVSLTAASGDYGADLILKSKDKKIVVQAKRYKKKVGLKAVQEIVSAKTYYKADESWVITNNYFTDPAKKLAAANNVTLINRDMLIKWMIEINKAS
jgi:restriction system protein